MILVLFAVLWRRAHSTSKWRHCEKEAIIFVTIGFETFFISSLPTFDITTHKISDIKIKKLE